MTNERYTLIREMCEGGLGKVWLARDNDLAPEVAIKEIKPGTESSQAARRLIREAQITGQLQHPNIVPVYEVNRGGRPFYAMKLVKGETLSEAIQRHHAQRRAGQADPLSLPRLLNAFVSICEALADAHSRGVIHRDLKPQNIVLGESGEVIVLDWGLAKVIGEPDDEAAPIALSPDAQADRTRDGATLATRSARSENDCELTTTSGERASRRGNSARSLFGETMIEFRDSVPMERSHAAKSQRNSPMRFSPLRCGSVPTGRPHVSPGHRPGSRKPSEFQAPTGRHQIRRT